MSQIKMWILSVDFPRIMFVFIFTCSPNIFVSQVKKEAWLVRILSC